MAQTVEEPSLAVNLKHAVHLKSGLQAGQEAPELEVPGSITPTLV